MGRQPMLASQQHMKSSNMWPPLQPTRAQQFMQPLRAEAAKAAPKAKPAKEPFSKDAWEAEFRKQLETPEKFFPEFGGSTGGLLSKAKYKEFYAITWKNDKKDVLFEMPTGGVAVMKDGQNLLFLARKEHCIMRGTRFRTKYKIKEDRVFRLFPNGEIQFLHPADGVFPEKANKGRVGANAELLRPEKARKRFKPQEFADSAAIPRGYVT